MNTVFFYSPGTCSLSGLVSLEWLGQPYRVVRVEREVRGTPEFKRVNPLAKVPAIQIDGAFLTENGAILAHLAARPGGEILLPKPGTRERDVANQWLSYLASGFHASFGPFFGPARYAADEAAQAAAKQFAVTQVRKQYEYVEAELGSKTYFLGETKTALDGYFYALSRWGKRLYDIPTDFPNIARHQATMEADAAVIFGLALEAGEATPANGTGGYLGHVALADV